MQPKKSEPNSSVRQKATITILIGLLVGFIVYFTPKASAFIIDVVPFITNQIIAAIVVAALTIAVAALVMAAIAIITSIYHENTEAKETTHTSRNQLNPATHATANTMPNNDSPPRFPAGSRTQIGHKATDNGRPTAPIPENVAEAQTAAQVAIKKIEESSTMNSKKKMIKIRDIANEALKSQTEAQRPTPSSQLNRVTNDTTEKTTTTTGSRTQIGKQPPTIADLNDISPS